MAITEKEPMQKHTLNLFAGDFERLQALYPDVGAAAVIRRLIRKHLDAADPKPDLTKLKEHVAL